jgi:hypothetical protein
LSEAIGWARPVAGALFFEMQSKNHPAIQLAQSLGFVFRLQRLLYPNEDISLFFSFDLR